MFKKSQLKVGNAVSPPGFPSGTIESIEWCSLESFKDGKKKLRWPCWTVRTNAPRPLHKYLIVDLGKDGLVVWKKSTRKFAPPRATLWVERSGLEEMENLAKPEDPYVYSMLVYVTARKKGRPYRLYCIERLRNSQLTASGIFRYEGVRIAG